MHHLRLKTTAYSAMTLSCRTDATCRRSRKVASLRCPTAPAHIQRVHVNCCTKQDADALESHSVRRAFQSVGVTADDLNRASRLEPALLSYTTDRLNGILDLLLGLGLTGSDVGKVLIAYPQVNPGAQHSALSIYLPIAFRLPFSS